MPANSYDIIIIGAGAAGVAAGRVLARHSKISFLLIEARDRLGGRAHTVNVEDMALDLGAGWLHAASYNLWREAAEREGFAIDLTAPPWGRDLQADPERAHVQQAMARFSARIETAANEPDRPASAYLTPGDPANQAIQAVCTYLNGVTLDHVSAHDYARYDGEGGNVRAKIGYGALIAALGRALPIALNTPALAVDHSGAHIRIETKGGALEAKAAIVCAPTPIIADGTLRFTPEISQARELAAGLPLGVVDKVFVQLHPRELPEIAGRFARPPALDKPIYDVRPMGQPVIEAFIAGPLASDLERAGESARAAFILDDLAGLGGSDLRQRLRVLVGSSWGCDPLSRGSYSYARPGRAEARAALAQPFAERIFFAGEACARAYFGTAHGAAETGAAAARFALDHVQARRGA